MGECVTPPQNATAKQRAAMASVRLQSPTSPFFLGSNDDQRERAQARAARVAASRRKSVPPPTQSDRADILNKGQIAELFQNCIKLASENKINQKNTWDLSLIDHLSEIIKIEDDDTETNFQKASCTLEAGVKIYSLRVDSVHSEAYKVLGGINRAGRGDDNEVVDSRDQVDDEKEDAKSRKELEKKMSPLSTLESSFEALNVKKFDVAFAIDPLYHQTSAQFDEGGAKGLLLNNLGVYGCCQVLFDSFERPGKESSCAEEKEGEEVMDISFLEECVEQMIIDITQNSDISPTLRDIVSLFNKDNKRPSHFLSMDQKAAGPDNMYQESQLELENDISDNCGSYSFDHEDPADMPDDCTTSADQDFSSSCEPGPNESFGNDGRNYVVYGMDGQFENVADFLHLGLDRSLKQNAWAGPDHWKYRKAKGTDQVSVAESDSQMPSKKQKNLKKPLIDIDFGQSIGKEMHEIFVPPKNKKTLLLSANRCICNSLLPEDCHYQPEDLVKLFLLPDVMCVPKSKRKFTSYEKEDDSYNCDPMGSWDQENGDFDDGNCHGDMEESSTLVSQPRQVNKIEVQYDKASKQVDVHALKETLWSCMQESIQKIDTGLEKMVSFQKLVAEFPVDCTAAALPDISPHLCFICLLHLANEHGLTICDCSTLDELQIYFPEHNALLEG